MKHTSVSLQSQKKMGPSILEQIFYLCNILKDKYNIVHGDDSLKLELRMIRYAMICLIIKWHIVIQLNNL